MFDIRNYDTEKKEETVVKANNDAFWTQTFIRKMDNTFPMINKECEALLKFKTSKSADAFENKLRTWKDFVGVLQNLCKLYKVENAKCLSKEN